MDIVVLPTNQFMAYLSMLFPHIFRSPTKFSSKFSIASLFGLLLIISSCSQILSPDKTWQQLIPENALGVVVPEKNMLAEALQSETLPLLDDFSGTSSSLISEINRFYPGKLSLQAIVLLPLTASDWKPVWLMEGPDNILSNVPKQFLAVFRQNSYTYKNHDIIILQISGMRIFAWQTDEHIAVSENSSAVERIVDTYLEDVPALNTERFPTTKSRFALNFSELDNYLRLEAAVKFKPYFEDAISGIGLADLISVSDTTEPDRFLTLRGSATLDKNLPPNARAFASINAAPFLDRYISGDAAAFGIFRITPFFDRSWARTKSGIDSVLLYNSEIREQILDNLEPEIAFVAFDASGVSSVGEDLIIRRTDSNKDIRESLEYFARRNWIQKHDNSYMIRNEALLKLLGGQWANYKQAFVVLTGSVVVISPRLGLSKRVQADRSRSRVIYYNKDYQSRRQQWPTELASLIWIRSSRFFQYVSPFLEPNHQVDLFSSLADEFVLYTQVSANSELNIGANFYRGHDRSGQPYFEQWVFPFSYTELSGPVVEADIAGSKRNELVFATTNGNVYGLASDGTVVVQLETGEDVPVGSPVVYDWYANNQNAIMIAAGNKIYAWNASGNSLPKFPITIAEKISSPLTIADINQDGVPEMIFATEDRNVYALNGRGVPMQGWPLKVNSVVRHPIQLSGIQNRRSLWFTSENAVFSVLSNGTVADGYPVFLQSTATADAFFHRDHAILPAADGHLYAVGSGLFPDSTDILRNVPPSEKPIKAQSIPLTMESLIGKISLQRTKIQVNDSLRVNEPVFLVQSSGGVLALINEKGQIRFIKNMGQPANEKQYPFFADIDKNGTNEIVSVASFGRMYAWTPSTGERFTRLPNAGLSYAFVSDLDGDGNLELIAQTREGLRCWTLNAGN